LTVEKDRMSEEFIQQVERLPAAIAEKFDFRVEQGKYLTVRFTPSFEENLEWKPSPCTEWNVSTIGRVTTELAVSPESLD
jgi:hypothetical protein